MNYWKISFGCLAGLVLAVASCGHPGGGGGGSGGNSGSGGSGNCTPGTLGCACNGSSCNDGLSCATDINQCVSIGTGSGGASASGGATGSGGAVSSGGDTGTGGSATGSGGSSPGNNLVTNGDFSQGMMDWNLTGSPSSSGVNNGEYCMMLTMSQGQIILGWGDSSTSLNLMANVNYTLTYQARASNGATVDVHIGQAVGSFNLDKDLGNDSPGSGTQTFTHMFSLTGADPQAGVAFLVTTSSSSGSMICFDNLVVTQG